MSKLYNIRWTDADNKELRRVVKNYNAKITRLEKKADKIISTSTDSDAIKDARTLKNALPDKASVKDIKKLIATRNDLKRELNSLKRFSKKGSESLVVAPGNEYNTKILKWQRTEMNRRASIINRKRVARREQIENIEMKAGGENLGYTLSQIGMGSIAKNELRPINSFTPFMTRTDMKKKFDVLKNESSDLYWHNKEISLKENYIKEIEKNFNSEDITAVRDVINDMDFEDFYSVYLSDGASFENVYPRGQKGDKAKGIEPDAEYMGYVEHLHTTWIPNYKKGK